MLMLVGIMLFSLFGCSKKDAEEKDTEDTVVSEAQDVESVAEGVAEAISNGEMEDVNKYFFDTPENELDDEMQALIEEGEEQDKMLEAEMKADLGMEVSSDEQDSTNQEGILGYLFSCSEVSVKEIGEDVITYEITSPDITNVFNDMQYKEKLYTEEEMIAYIKEYTEKAEMKTYEVQVAYTEENGVATVDYQNEEFIDAISGGFLTAYKQLYTEMVDSYREEVQ